MQGKKDGMSRRCHVLHASGRDLLHRMLMVRGYAPMRCDFGSLGRSR